MAILGDGTVAPMTAGIPQTAAAGAGPAARSRDALVGELAAVLGVEPEELDDLIDGLGKPRVMGVYPPDPAEAMERKRSTPTSGSPTPATSPYAAGLP